jgi:TolA-binding protein
MPAASVQYERAVGAYDAQEYADAAKKFASFVAAHPRAPEVEDAMFLEANALARSGRADEASEVAERFVARFPDSFHARDAAILAARGARNRGDCRKVLRLLEPWRSVATPDVSTLLGACAE